MKKTFYKQAHIAASQILESMFVSEPPVDTDAIAQELGLTIFEMKMPDKLKNVAGFLDYEEMEIVVNQDDHKVKQNFTVAHEIGHFVLHKDQIENNPGIYKALLRSEQYDGNEEFEKQANAFAVELLAPKYLLKKYSYLPINTLAKLFGVSPKLIGFRMKNKHA